MPVSSQLIFQQGSAFLCTVIPDLPAFAISFPRGSLNVVCIFRKKENTCNFEILFGPCPPERHKEKNVFCAYTPECGRCENGFPVLEIQKWVLLLQWENHFAAAGKLFHAV